MFVLRRAGWLAAILLAGQLCFTLSATPAEYSPLNCVKAETEAQKVICSDYGLGQQEARMAALYAMATSLVAMGQRGNIQEEQRAFLKERDACGSNVNCIRTIYGHRIRQLDAVMTGIIQRGPF